MRIIKLVGNWWQTIARNEYEGDIGAGTFHDRKYNKKKVTLAFTDAEGSNYEVQISLERFNKIAEYVAQTKWEVGR